jgi:hypothetical protein
MERVYFADRQGTQILHVDYTGLDDPEDLYDVVRRASALVQKQPPGSLYVLADLTGVPHTLVTAAIMQQGVAESRPHVRARAVVGLSADAASSFDVAAKLFRSPMARFADSAAAMEWLLEQARLAATDPTPP